MWQKSLVERRGDCKSEQDQLKTGKVCVVFGGLLSTQEIWTIKGNAL